MEIKHIPQAVKDGHFEGYIMVDLPGYYERKKIMKEYGIKLTPQGSVDFSERSMFDIITDMVKQSKKLIKEISLKRDSIEYKEFSQLIVDPYCESILDELGLVLLNGVQLGKKPS